MNVSTTAPMDGEPRLRSSWAHREKVTAHARTRTENSRAIIENPLSHFTDAELQEDVHRFVVDYLPSISEEKLLRAARVAKDIRLYDEAARSPFGTKHTLLVELTEEEKRALRGEKDVTFSERGMWIVIATVSIAALLQGFVQSSFNGASLYTSEWGMAPTAADGGQGQPDDWRLGAANASPWFFAALVGCPLSLPINYWYGRRGGIGVAAFLIFCSSVGAIFATTWTQLFGVRVLNGLGMGIKAVSTPILASETAIGFWRGTAILAWQLWVAFGIMMGFAFNLIFTNASTSRITYGLIQGAPLVPALALFFMVTFVCPESPRYHLMKGPNYSVEKSYKAMRRVRNTELQAMRDMYLVIKSTEAEHLDFCGYDARAVMSPGIFWVLRDFIRQFAQLFQRRRLFNAVVAAGVVNLAQQLCGVNVFAFYSGTLFTRVGTESTVITMAYSLGFGAINFIFALPAIRSIDTIGRRRLLLITLPFMAMFMLGAGLSGFVVEETSRIGITACFLFLFAVAYSPGLGPIPFTLASESFPMSHREAGTAFSISINLLFAGLLAIFFPSINSALGQAGSLGLFAGLNVVALVLVFLFVEETKQHSLEELDQVFAVAKREFMRFQVTRYLPWCVKHYVFGSLSPKPELYRDLVWGSISMPPPEEQELKRAPVVMPDEQCEVQHIAHAMSPIQSHTYVTITAGGAPSVPSEPSVATSIYRPSIPEMEDSYPRAPGRSYVDNFSHGRPPVVPDKDDRFQNYTIPRR